MKTINGTRYEKAQAISKGNTYRLDLNPDSETMTALSYDFMTGWTFTIGETKDTVSYSATELKQRLERGTIWRQVK